MLIISFCEELTFLWLDRTRETSVVECSSSGPAVGYSLPASFLDSDSSIAQSLSHGMPSPTINSAKTCYVIK